MIGWSHILEVWWVASFGPHVVPFSAISESMVHRHQMQAMGTSISWHTMYWIFMGAGLYKMAMAIDQRPVLRSTRIATYHALDRCSSLPALTTRGVILCIERGWRTLIPHLYRKAIGAYNGTMWIFQDMLPLRKSSCSNCMPPWYHEDARRVALYRGAIGGVANPFGYRTWQDIYLYILYASDIVFMFMPQKWFRWW